MKVLLSITLISLGLSLAVAEAAIDKAPLDLLPTKQIGESVPLLTETPLTEALDYEDAEATETIREAVKEAKAGEEEAAIREETAEESEELTYVEQVGNKHCPLADGRNMFQDSCHRFVICSNGQVSHFSRCPVGQIFEPSIANCIDIGRAVRRDCSSAARGGRTAAVQKYCRSALDQLVNNGLSPRFYDRDLFPLPADPCRKFVTCNLNGLFQIGSCPKGTAFAPRARQCLPRHKVRNPKCKSTQ